MQALETQVFASPSSHDGAPNSLLEAMDYGCCPAVGDIDAMREWVEGGVKGLLVDPCDPDALAGAPDLITFVASVKWTYAKTMPKWPHEYIVRRNVDEALFAKLVKLIRSHAYEDRFYNKPITYYDFGGMTYWTMGAPIDETIIINRCRKEDTYESRLAEGRLPEG